jgi:phosphate/phosphite/phosphonate ABC transporter binding protein
VATEDDRREPEPGERPGGTPADTTPGRAAGREDSTLPTGPVEARSGPDAPPADEPLPRVLEGRWRLERELGAGGMGRVFEARHQSLGTRAAVKLLHPQRLASPEAVRRFLREARLAGVAGHPGIARVLDFDLTAAGTPYMVMELLVGATLEARLAAQDRISLTDGVDVLLDVLDTLAAIHAAGVVHRDIKPGNIFVLAEPGAVRAKLLDFGLARGADPLEPDADLTRTGQVLGTPHYMSPEQARGQTQVGPEADLWAVGVMLYQLVTGLRPFPGENYNETLAAILTRDPAPVRQIAPGLPPALDALVRRCLDRDAGRRFRTAAELRAALAALRPQLARARPWSARRSRRRLFLAAVAAAGALAVGWAFLAGRGGPAREVVRATWSPYRDRAFMTASTRWLLDELGDRIDRRFEFTPAGSYDQAAELLLGGRVDVAGLSPASYAQAAARAPGLVLLGRIRSNGADTYQSILFTRSDSRLRVVADARGAAICFVDRSSTSGYVYPRAMLRRAGVDPDRDLGPVHFAGDHERVIELLAAGRCDVAGSSSSALTQWAEEAGTRPAMFRILEASDSIPGDALVARADLPPLLLARLRAAAAGIIADTAAGRFPAAREISGLVAAEDRDYDVVRALGR